MFQFFDRASAKVLFFAVCLVLAGLQVGGCSSREQRAKNHYDQGMSYLAKKDFPKARIEFRNALQLKGNMLEAWRALAQVDEHDQNWRSLTESLQHVTEIDDKDTTSRVRLAKLYLLGGNLDQALKLTNAAVELEPQSAAILGLRAVVLFRLKDVQGATLEAEKALKIDPGSTDAIAVLASDKFEQGDYAGALQSLAKITAPEDDTGILLLKLRIFDRMGNLQQIESTLRKLIELHPKDPVLRNQLIAFYIAHKRPDDAEKELRRVISADPNDINAELELINVIGAVKGPAAARTELVARINAGGQVFPYQIELAKFDFEHDRAADGINLLKQLIDSSKSTADALAARITLAKLYMSKNDIAAAEPLVTEILSADSRNIEGLGLRASIRLARGQVDDAIGDLRQALNDQPASPALLLNLAVAYERTGLIELADKAFLEAMKTSNFAPVFGLNYVSFLQRRGSNERAENVLVELASRSPGNIAVLTALANAKLARHDWVGAHQLADEIQRLSNKSQAADEIHAAAFAGQEKFAESLASSQDAYNASPGAVQPMADLVGGYLRAQQVDKAESFIRAVLKANPANANALVLLGTIQLAKRDPKLARNNFEAAVKLQPKNPIGYVMLAGLDVRENKVDEAINTISTGLQHQPRDFNLRLTLAGLMESKGQYDAAIAEYETMLKDQPNSMIVANNLASMLADHRTDKASLDRAYSLAQILKGSQFPQFRETLGWVDYQHGDYAAAVALLEDSVAKRPDNGLIRYHLGMCYLATGQQAKAEEQFTKARQLAPNDTALNKKIDAALQAPPEKGKS